MRLLTRYELIGIGVSIAVMALVLVSVRAWQTDSVPTTDPNAEAVIVAVDAATEDQDAALAAAIVEASDRNGRVEKLIVQDVVVGSGRTVRAGDTVTLHYVGMVKDGAQFNNTYTTGIPYTFTVGTREVIEGWDHGVIGMQEGGRRVLVIPASLAYGNREVGPVAPNSTLIFALELLSIE